MSDYDYEEQYRTQPKPVAPAPTATITTINPTSVIDTPAPTVPTGQDYVEDYRVNPPPTQPGYVNETTVIQPQPAPSPATQLIHQEEVYNQPMLSQTAQLNATEYLRLADIQASQITAADLEYGQLASQKDQYTPESWSTYEQSYLQFKTDSLSNILALKGNASALELYAGDAKLYETQFNAFMNPPSARSQEILSQSQMVPAPSSVEVTKGILREERYSQNFMQPDLRTPLEKVVGDVEKDPVGGAVLGGLTAYENVMGAPSVALRGGTEGLLDYADRASLSADPLQRILGVGAAIGGYGAAVGAGVWDFSTFLVRPSLIAGTAFGLAMVGVGGVQAIQGDSAMLRGIGASLVGRGGTNLVGMIGGAALTPSVFNVIGRGVQKLRPRYQVNEILEVKATEVGTVQEGIGDVSYRPGEGDTLTLDVVRGEQSPLMKTEYTGVSKPIPREVAALYPDKLSFDTVIGVESSGEPIAVRGVSGEGIAPPKGAKMGEAWTYEKVEANLEISRQRVEAPTSSDIGTGGSVEVRVPKYEQNTGLELYKTFKENPEGLFSKAGELSPDTIIELDKIVEKMSTRGDGDFNPLRKLLDENVYREMDDLIGKGNEFWEKGQKVEAEELWAKSDSLEPNSLRKSTVFDVQEWGASEENPANFVVKEPIKGIDTTIEPVKLSDYNEIGGAGGGGAGKSWARIDEPALNPKTPNMYPEVPQSFADYGKLTPDEVGLKIEGWIERPSVGEVPTRDMFSPYDLNRPYERLPMGEPIVEGGVEGIKPTEIRVDVKAATITPKPAIEPATPFEAPTGTKTPFDYGKAGKVPLNEQVKGLIDYSDKNLQTPYSKSLTGPTGSSVNDILGGASESRLGSASKSAAASDLVGTQSIERPASLSWVSKAAPVNIVGGEASLFGVASAARVTQPQMARDVLFSPQRTTPSLYSPQGSASLLGSVVSPKLRSITQPDQFTSLRATQITTPKMATQLIPREVTTPRYSTISNTDFRQITPPSFKTISVNPLDTIQRPRNIQIQSPLSMPRQLQPQELYQPQPTRTQQIQTPKQSTITLPDLSAPPTTPKMTPPTVPTPPLLGSGNRGFSNMMWGSRKRLGKERRRYMIGNPLEGWNPGKIGKKKVKL